MSTAAPLSSAPDITKSVLSLAASPHGPPPKTGPSALEQPGGPFRFREGCKAAAAAPPPRARRYLDTGYSTLVLGAGAAGAGCWSCWCRGPGPGSPLQPSHGLIKVPPSVQLSADAASSASSASSATPCSCPGTCIENRIKPSSDDLPPSQSDAAAAAARCRARRWRRLTTPPPRVALLVRFGFEMPTYILTENPNPGRGVWELRPATSLHKFLPAHASSATSARSGVSVEMFCLLCAPASPLGELMRLLPSSCTTTLVCAKSNRIVALDPGHTEKHNTMS